MRRIVEARDTVSFALAVITGAILYRYLPFDNDADLVRLIYSVKPAVSKTIEWTYIALLFTTPYFVLSSILSIAYIFVSERQHVPESARLPRYPPIDERRKLVLVVGEVHETKKHLSSPSSHWLVIPDRGLFTGIAIVGAIGSGKTSCCMMPFADQILGFAADDAEKRVSGLVLEVKGDFCYKVKQILSQHGREADYVEVSLRGEFRYNPLHNDQDAYTLAFGIATLLNNLFGRGKEPFWQQAYTNLVKFIILLHKVLYDYVTLFDVYECAINPRLIENRIAEGEARFGTEWTLVDIETFERYPALDECGFELDHTLNRLKARTTEELTHHLKANGIVYESCTLAESENAEPIDQTKRHQFEAVKRWFFHDWNRIDPKLRTSIVEGISVFLSLFDDHPDVRRVFCPPKETYAADAGSDFKQGSPLPPFSELIETGKVVALNFPVSLNPGLAKTIGTLMKLDFERAVLNRIPRMESEPNRHWREVLFLCDEYQAFATVGENDPTGDEKFFSLSRQAKCMPIVATQSISSLRSTLPGESWRTLFQTFRTKIFLTLSDDFSAETASRLCGKEEMLKPSYSLSENGQDAAVSFLSGRATSHKATLSTTKSYSIQVLPTFEAKVFAELKNAQAIVLAYDGLNPLPPTFCYLKPYYLDTNQSYFEQLAAGAL